MNNKQIINEVFQELKERNIHPSGGFDNAGRFYAEHQNLINVREPSRSFPFSQMSACRTKKYVAKVCDLFGCTSVDELKAKV